MREVDPHDGPAGSAIAASAPLRRLWMSRAASGEEAYTGLAATAAGRPVEVCWHVSRPGESATAAIADLTGRFPPAEGSVQTGTELFCGGYRRWTARISGVTALLGVSWAMREQPDQGSALLYLVRKIE